MSETSHSAINEKRGAALHIDISEAKLVAELQREAKRKKQSPAQLVSRILEEYLEELEDYRALKAATRRDKGKANLPAAEVFRRNGLEG